MNQAPGATTHTQPPRSSSNSDEAIHLIVPTHTTRHLELCLVGIALQDRRPDTITVTCDVVDSEIENLLRRLASKLRIAIRYVRRPNQGKERLAQVRNNAVRSLIRDGFSSGRLVFLDGDTLAPPTCIRKHLEFGRCAEMVLPARIDLDESTTFSINAESLLVKKGFPEPSPESLRSLNRLHRKSRFHQFLRRLNLTKAHKPKLLGGHHSVSFEAFRRVNGHDEEYHTWGTEDDDFARRIYRTGGTSIVAIRDIIVFHLYHPTRAPQDWHDRENARRFQRRSSPDVCRYGLRNPLPQDPVLTDIF